jgi:hypothetical protein
MNCFVPVRGCWRRAVGALGFALNPWTWLRLCNQDSTLFIFVERSAGKRLATAEYLVNRFGARPVREPWMALEILYRL